MNKKLLLSTIVVLLSINLLSQTISYEYDANGNRIKREVIVLNTKSSIIENVSDSIENPSLYVINKEDFKIYPNPTKGNLKIDISSQVNIDNIYINIINVKGQKIYERRDVSMSYNLDLFSQVNGVYILNVIVNDKKYSWKIIKE
jgi:hypothetical protein